MAAGADEPDDSQSSLLSHAVGLADQLQTLCTEPTPHSLLNSGLPVAQKLALVFEQIIITNAGLRG